MLFFLSLYSATGPPLIPNGVLLLLILSRSLFLSTSIHILKSISILESFMYHPILPFPFPPSLSLPLLFQPLPFLSLPYPLNITWTDTIIRIIYNLYSYYNTSCLMCIRGEINVIYLFIYLFIMYLGRGPTSTVATSLQALKTGMASRKLSLSISSVEMASCPSIWYLLSGPLNDPLT